MYLTHTHSNRYIRIHTCIHTFHTHSHPHPGTFKRPKVDVSKILCRYELHGECKDVNCKDLHIRNFFPPGHPIPQRAHHVHTHRVNTGTVWYFRISVFLSMFVFVCVCVSNLKHINTCVYNIYIAQVHVFTCTHTCMHTYMHAFLIRHCSGGTSRTSNGVYTIDTNTHVHSRAHTHAHTRTKTDIAPAPQAEKATTSAPHASQENASAPENGPTSGNVSKADKKETDGDHIMKDSDSDKVQKNSDMDRLRNGDDFVAVDTEIDDIPEWELACEDEEGPENAAGQWRYFGLEADLQEWK
jgi:hypothetical protein